MKCSFVCTHCNKKYLTLDWKDDYISKICDTCYSTLNIKNKEELGFILTEGKDFIILTEDELKTQFGKK